MGDNDREKTSSTLMDRLRDPQDQEAWGEFLRTYGRLILWGCSRCGLNAHDAEEASQEVLLNVRNAMVKGTYVRAMGRSFRGWLHTVVVRAAGKERRKPRPVTGIEGLVEGLSGRVLGGRLVEGDDPTIPQTEWDMASLSCLFERALERIREEFPENEARAFEETSVTRENGEEGRNYLTVSDRILPGSAPIVAKALGWTDQRVYKARHLIWPRFVEILREFSDEDRWN
jgi:DNA-directed RNA polymerase specialized sigma24 family protein